MLSWGFLLQRGALLGLAMNNLLSRVPGVMERVHNPEDNIEGGYMVEKNSDIAILGRIVLNLWRLLRFEVLSMIPLISFVSIFAVKKKEITRNFHHRLQFRVTRSKIWFFTYFTGVFSISLLKNCLRGGRVITIGIVQVSKKKILQLC